MMLEVPAHLVPALTRMLKVSAKKRSDYSGEGPWMNFRVTAEHFGIPDYEAADFLELTKLARIRALRDGRKVQNESVEDTYLDKANYALFAYAMYLASVTTAQVQEDTLPDPEYDR